MSSQHKYSLAVTYRVPPEHYDVEATAQQLFLYLKANAEDTTALAADPTARDKAIAKLHSDPNVTKPTLGRGSLVGPYEAVPLGGDVDGYLAEMHALMDKPAFTAEEHVRRVMYAYSALVVFREYKVNLALGDNTQLFRQVMVRTNQLLTAYVAQFLGQSASSVPPTDLRGESLTLLEGEVQEILGDVVLLCQRRFKRTDTAQGEHTWRVTSFSGTERGIEYKVLCEGDSDSVPMDQEELAGLLRTSTLA